MSVTLSPNKHAASAEASSHTSCTLSQLACGWTHQGASTFCTLPNVKIKHHGTFWKFNKITQEPQIPKSSHVQLHSCKKKRKKNAQASLFYNWRWCKCWLNAEKQAIRFCISERKNFELNVCLPKYLLICGANNTALILQWNKTTWLLTLWCRYGSFLSRPEVRVHPMVQAKPWNGSNWILANQQEYGGKKRNVASRVSSVCTTNSKI